MNFITFLQVQNISTILCILFYSVLLNRTQNQERTTCALKSVVFEALVLQTPLVKNNLLISTGRINCFHLKCLLDPVLFCFILFSRQSEIGEGEGSRPTHACERLFVSVELCWSEKLRISSRNWRKPVSHLPQYTDCCKEHLFFSNTHYVPTFGKWDKSGQIYCICMRNIQVFIKKLAFTYGFWKTLSVSKLLQKPNFTWMWEYCFIKTSLSAVFPKKKAPEEGILRWDP